jgi:hypothetical protein
VNERARSSDRRTDAEAPPGAVRPVSWAERAEAAAAAAAAAAERPPATGDRSWRGGPAAGRGRGYGTNRTAQLLRLQQTEGNRAVQRLLRRQAGAGEAPGEADLATRLRGAGPGQALQPGVQRRLEDGLGADLSGVRVHADAEADGLSRALEAEAFTSGRDVYFRAGAYDPASSDGMRLLAHEAVHTVQQAAGPVAGTPVPGGVAVSDPGDAFERAAVDQAARLASPVAEEGALPAPSPAGPGIPGVLQRAGEETAPAAAAPAAATDPGAPAPAGATADAPTPAVDAAKLSGAHWPGIADANGWKNINSLDDLADPFKTNASSFIAAMESAGASVAIETTKRPIERAWLMHSAWTVASGGAAPTDDPYSTGIVWDHGTAEKSKAAAKEMIGKSGFNMAVDADMDSRHFSGNAVDMYITNLPETWTFTRDGKEVTVDLGAGAPATNKKLWDAAATHFSVKKLTWDPPHWSDTGG